MPALSAEKVARLYVPVYVRMSWYANPNLNSYHGPSADVCACVYAVRTYLCVRVYACERAVQVPACEAPQNLLL